MKRIVKEKYLYADRKGEGLDVFIDFPKHVIHLKQYEKGGQYFLLYFSDVESAQFEKACNDDNTITMFDNSYFEYKIKGMMPSMTSYVNYIVKNKPDIVMADVNFDEYNSTWAESAARMLLPNDSSTLLMVIPHGNTIEEIADMIELMNTDMYVDVIGIPYQFNGFDRASLIAYCVSHGKWCWDKSVHLLGLADANEIQDHRDLIRICQNIISIDTSYPVLLGCDNFQSLEVGDDKRFIQGKPSINIVDCPVDTTDKAEAVILANIKTFKNTICDLTTGYAKIAFVGAAGAGKTTTAKELTDLLNGRGAYLKYPAIHEICDYRDPEKAGLATALYTGCNLMAAYMRFSDNIILDRCLIDNIAYAIYDNNETQVKVFREAFNMFCTNISSIAWVHPLDNPEIEDDGKRITDREVQKTMHGIFADVIKGLDVAGRPVVTLKGNLSVEDRIWDLLKSI